MAFPNENQKIFMITGKGGVGKSAVAAALAQKKAREGAKTLLVELGDQSYYQYVYGQPIRYEPTSISKNFSISLWSGESCLREYVYHLLKIRKIVDLFFDNHVMKAFIKAAPALKELAILGKITSGIRQWGPSLEYDVIVVDGFATGHFMALLRAPIGMGELISSGPMGEQSRRIEEVLQRPDLCEYVIVTLPEELPVSETEDLHFDLLRTVRQNARILCNRITQCPLDLRELDELIRAETPNPESFVVYLRNSIERESVQLERLKKINVPVTLLPFQLTANGRSVIDRIEETLP